MNKWILIKNYINVKCNSRDLIGLATKVYEPLYHAREIVTMKISSGCPYTAKSARSSNLS